MLSDESRLEKISLVANPETTAVSTTVIYEFEVGPEGNASAHVSSFYRFRRLGNNNLATLTFKFRVARLLHYLLSGPDRCEATLICSELTGNVCGSYELTVSYGEPENSETSMLPVCHRAQYYSGVVAPGQGCAIAGVIFHNTVLYSNSQLYRVSHRLVDFG